MNQIATMNAAQMMTSREIAELTGKQHKHVIRDIESMANDLGPDLGLALKSSTYIDLNGVSRKQYELDKEMTMTLVTGYSIPLRHAVIKRWQELESKASQPAIPTDYVSALRLAADTQEQLLIAQKEAEEQRIALEKQAPAVEFFETVTHDSSTMSVAEAAKSIGTGERRLYEFMRQHGWVTRDNVPYQQPVDRGYLNFKRSRYQDSKGDLRDKYTTRVTEKGKSLLLRQIKRFAPSILN